ncbi:MAG: hypothetical protein ACRD3N_07125 [Terracidiphilus sp.]
MHIHGNSMNLNAANFSSPGLQNRAALEAQRAAETRKRLLNKSQSLEAESGADSDATLLIGHWLDGEPGQTQDEDAYGAVPSSRDNNFG